MKATIIFVLLAAYCSAEGEFKNRVKEMTLQGRAASIECRYDFRQMFVRLIRHFPKEEDEMFKSSCVCTMEHLNLMEEARINRRNLEYFIEPLALQYAGKAVEVCADIAEKAGKDDDRIVCYILLKCTVRILLRIAYRKEGSEAPDLYE